jgi:hypothetical protein
MRLFHANSGLGGVKSQVHEAWHGFTRHSGERKGNEDKKKEPESTRKNLS